MVPNIMVEEVLFTNQQSNTPQFFNFFNQYHDFRLKMRMILVLYFVSYFTEYIVLLEQFLGCLCRRGQITSILHQHSTSSTDCEELFKISKY